jgi:hypothetical protein
MSTRVKEVTQALKTHDSCLYAQETKLGRIDIMRKSKYGESPPNLLMSLTDTWTAQGNPVPWGAEVILNRIKAHDLWRDDTFVERWIKDQEKAEASKQRAFRNNVESFLYDFRGQFHKATNEINTSLLNKVSREEKNYGFRE